MTGMINIEIRHDARVVRALLAGYAGGAEKVLARTLNRVMEPSVKTAAAREIAAGLGVPVGRAKQALKIGKKAYVRSLSIDLKADAKRIPLIAFKARQTKAGVTYKIGKSPRKLLPRAFINVGPTVGRTVLKRDRDGNDVDDLVPRYPVFIKYGPSPAAIFIQEAVQKALDTTARERWVRELTAQIKFFLSKQPG